MNNQSRATSFFEEMIMEGGTTVAICDYCGRCHFESHDLSQYRDGELERYRELAERKPSDYVEHLDDDSIGIGEIAGQLLVIGCPCEGMVKWEAWLWNNSAKISEYFKKRSGYLKEQVEKKMKGLDLNGF